MRSKQGCRPARTSTTGAPDICWSTFSVDPHRMPQNGGLVVAAPAGTATARLAPTSSVPITSRARIAFPPSPPTLTPKGAPARTRSGRNCLLEEGEDRGPEDLPLTERVVDEVVR